MPQIVFPAVKDSAVQYALDLIRRAFSRAVSQDEAANNLLLQDSSGKWWQVTVSTAGALVVAAWNDPRT